MQTEENNSSYIRISRRKSINANNSLRANDEELNSRYFFHETRLKIIHL